MDGTTTSGGGQGDAFLLGEVWAEVPVRVDWAAAAAQCAWVRALLVVPAVRALVALSLAMTVMILAEKLFVCAVCLAVRVLRLRPERRYRWEPIVASPAGDEEEAGGARHPMVLVQIPMYNEREVRTESGVALINRWCCQLTVVCSSLVVKGVQAVDRRGMRAGVAVRPLRHPGAGRLHGPRCKGTSSSVLPGLPVPFLLEFQLFPGFLANHILLLR